MKFKKFIIICGLLTIVCGLVGCDAFVRKFTRKSKKEKVSGEMMVLAPEEYKSNMTKEDLYRQYFLFWKSWQDELIGSLSRGANHKKQVDCAKQAINNLTNLRVLLNEEKKNKLDIYIRKLSELEGLIEKDVYSNNIAITRPKSEQLKREILRDFSYDKVKKYLI
jgi:hypothetical protein